MGTKTPKLFAREATGLVRQFSALEAAAINWSGLTVFPGLITYFAFSYLFPNGSLFWAMVISILGFTSLAICYAMSTVAMPRSGGDYVFISRTLHPTLGFMLVLSLNIWFSFYSGAFANWIFTLGLSPSLDVIGYITGNSAYLSLANTLSQPLVIILFGSFIIIVTAVIAIVQPRLAARLVTLFIMIGFLSLAVISLVFLFNNTATFRTAFNTFSLPYAKTSDYYSSILSEAEKNGLSQLNTFSLSQTLSLVPFGAYIFLYVSEMQAVGGEIKNAKRTPYYAALITLSVASLFALLPIIGLNQAVTKQFNNAINFVYYNGLNYSLPIAPTFNLFASLLVKNVLIAWLINIGLVTTNIALLLMFYMFTPRYFLAASFDSIMPQKLSSVSERFHTPHIAIIVTAILALITLPIYTIFATLLSTLSAVLGELLFGYLVFSISAILFPFSPKSKRMYQSSPINYTIGKIPVITLFGVISTGFMTYIAYYLLTNSQYGVNSFVSLVAVLLIAISAPIWYYIKKAYLRSKGFDLDAVFSEVPPE
jgi:amino acid transporter